MRVIGVGFGRTGTASLMAALDRVGAGPCYHMFHVLQQPQRARDWLNVARGQEPDWERIFAGFQSTVDWPAAAFWRELIEAYPKAKVILTVRDPQRWYDSAQQTIFRAAERTHSRAARPLMRLIGLVQPGFPDFIAMTDAIVMNRVFDGRMADREYAVGLYERHIEEVRAAVPESQLLVFNVAEGWGPLCAFLDVPVPDEPFPHLNDTEEFNSRQAARMRQLLRPLAIGGGLAVAVTVATGWALLRRVRPRAKR